MRRKTYGIWKTAPCPGKILLSFAFLLLAAACLFSASCSCASETEEMSAQDNMEKILKNMSPEERANFEALQKEKARLKAEYRERPSPARGSGEKKLWKRHSTEKREKLDDTSAPVLLREAGSSSFPWKKDVAPRSEKLQEEQRSRCIR